MKRIFLVIALMFGFTSIMKGQQVIVFDAVSNGKIVVNCGAKIQFSDGNYPANMDRYVTFCAENPIEDQVVLTFESFKVHWSDTVWIHQGTGIDPVNNPLVPVGKGATAFNWRMLLGRSVESPVTGPGCLTLRMKTDGDTNAHGFVARTGCKERCQTPSVELDTFFYRVTADGTMIKTPVKHGLIDSLYTDSVYSHWDSLDVPQIDSAITNIDTVVGDTTWRVDTTYVVLINDTILNAVFYDTVHYDAIDLCAGDSIILVSKVTFPYNNLLYSQDINTCALYWNFGDCDTIKPVYGTNLIGHRFLYPKGYNLELNVEDTTVIGCRSDPPATARVRISQNPIKSIADLPDICSGTYTDILTGRSGAAAIMLDSIESPKGESGTYANPVFIPDGPNCDIQCYESPIVFKSFGAATVQSGNDIFSVCLNMEHTYVGDLGIRLYCPSGKYASLKLMLGMGKDNGAYLGMANTANACLDKCVDTCHAPGIGWNYCWSNQPPFSQSYKQPRGLFTRTHQVALGALVNGSMGPSNPVDSTGYYQTPAQLSPDGDAWTGPTPENPNPPAPSLTDATADITVDLNGFDELIGCPMNGEWKIQICDYWPSDDGWIFEWSLSLRNSCYADWGYDIVVDSVAWEGPFLHALDSVTMRIAPPIDTGGYFRYGIHVIDNLGCSWDTAAFINIIETPRIDLGDDFKMCEGETVILDAEHRAATDYTWSDGSHNAQLSVTPVPNSPTNLSYNVLLFNNSGAFPCTYRDSVHIEVVPKALAQLYTDPPRLEGCEPFTFQLFNTSSYVDSVQWQVGDYVSYEQNPVFTLPYGTYDVILRVISEGGCTDSIILTGNDAVHVYAHPVPDFAWEPTNPFASAPSVQMINLTQPDYPNSIYQWRYQTNKGDSTAVQTVVGKNPLISWQPQSGQTVSGDYDITLFATVVGQGSDGHTHECIDSLKRTITIVNDNLIFPSVVTPNGDGINDMFIIHNLIDGQAFPDNELTIYNRYGRRIYFKEDIRINEEGWDPAETNTPDGTYFYHFVGRGPVRDVECTGTIDVIRK